MIAFHCYGFNVIVDFFNSYYYQDLLPQHSFCYCLLCIALLSNLLKLSCIIVYLLTISVISFYSYGFVVIAPFWTVIVTQIVYHLLLYIALLLSMLYHVIPSEIFLYFMLNLLATINMFCLSFACHEIAWNKRK